MSTAQHTALVHAYYRDLANADPATVPAAAERLLADDFVFYAPNDTAGDRGRDTHVGFLAWHHGVVPDETWTVDELIVDAQTVVSRVTFQGTQQGEFAGVAPSGKRFTYHGVDIFRVADGTLTELRRYFDVLTVLEQIGGRAE